MQAAGLAAREIKGSSKETSASVRWQRDISMKHVVFFMTIALVAVLIFFWIGVLGNFWQALVAWLVVTLISFLFTTVAANAIAIVGSNPVSGMTLMTLIIASAIFVGIGINGTSGIVASMVIGGVVCTALSMAGRICHRPENRLLARLDSSQTGKLEISRHFGVCRHCGRCNTAIK